MNGPDIYRQFQTNRFDGEKLFLCLMFIMKSIKLNSEFISLKAIWHFNFFLCVSTACVFHWIDFFIFCLSSFQNSLEFCNYYFFSFIFILLLWRSGFLLTLTIQTQLMLLYSTLFINRKTKQYSGRHDYVFLAESKGLNK